MNIRQLTIFKTVCEELNFTKTAEKLFMTQPAISRAVSELEEECGCVLLDRISKKVYVTNSGKILYEKSVHLLECYNDLSRSLTNLEQEPFLNIGSSITIANFWLPQILTELKHIYKNCRFHVEVESASNMERRLKENQLDLALIEGVIKNEDFIKIPFSSYKIQFVCSPNHRLAHVQSISSKDIIKEELLLREKGSAIRDAFDSALYLQNLTATPVWTSVNSQALIQAAKKNLGIAVVADVVVKKEIEAGELVVLNIEEIVLENKNYIVYHKKKSLSNIMLRFIDLVNLS